MATRVEAIHSEQEVLNSAAVAVAMESPQLIRALIDFKRARESGKLEIHFSQGGIAKIFAMPLKTYK